MRGSGRESRDFLFIEDAAAALLDIVMSDEIRINPRLVKVNVASGSEIAVSTLAETLMMIIGSDKPIKYLGIAGVGAIPNAGWLPLINLEESYPLGDRFILDRLWRSLSLHGLRRRIGS